MSSASMGIPQETEACHGEGAVLGKWCRKILLQICEKFVAEFLRNFSRNFCGKITRKILGKFLWILPPNMAWNHRASTEVEGFLRNKKIAHARDGHR